ncbi:hypothetical protein KY338_02160 [Candidatus Woesearchaeota archaeon]|nr:hypothetical protein [Candidatus Woesearchaeota archaeon]MBW3006095.1 hypothetical protein [Candidatus Woesearchaeota archaeon]
MASVLGNVIGFLQKIGIYDVVLPFLLTFTIVFAILEKTKILGSEEIEGKKYTKKNLNAMVAFVIGFLVIASGKLVEAITTVSANIIILLLLSVFFLMLVGTFFKKDEDVALEGFWRYVFMIVMFVGIVAIFLSAIKTDAGISWLQVILNWISMFWTSAAVASIILIIGIIVFVWLMVNPPKWGKEEEEEKGKGKS